MEVEGLKLEGTIMEKWQTYKFQGLMLGIVAHTKNGCAAIAQLFKA
jgi:hypothetical protein